MTDLPIMIRDMRDADRPLILHSWLRSYHANGDMCRGVPSALFYRHHHALADTMLGRAKVLVACNPEADDVAFGWACYERDGIAHDLLHYVYVKHAFHGFGVATRLLSGLSSRVTYTHRTRVCSALPIPEDWEYDPYRFLAP